MYILFSKKNWAENRSINLMGEASFDVTEGNTFIVESKQGSIEVLGTQFTVNDRDNFYELLCFSGKVKWSSSQFEERIVEEGFGITISNGSISEISSPESIDWLMNESSFYDVDFKIVIEEFERQFDVEVIGKNKIAPGTFNGRFKHDSLENAARTIFESMDVQYEIDDQGNILIQEIE